MLDLGLAIFHHLLVFGLVVILAAERSLMRASVIDVTRLARIDGGYGLIAALILIVGAGRVAMGGKGWAFYAENPFFWAKIAVFVVIGLLSIAPTIQFVRWSRQVRADPAFQPAAAELKRAQSWVGLELLLIFPLVALAAAMARYPF